MRRSRLLARFSAAGALLATLAACSGGTGGTSTSEPLPTIKGNPPVTLTVFAPQQDWVDDMDKNAFTDLIKDEFNITIKWQTTTLDATAAKEKRQISLASGDLPDVYLLIPWLDQFSQAELLRYGGQGIIQPLNQLIDQYAPNIQDAFTETPEFERMATAPDDNIYGMPQWNDCYHCSHGFKTWINQEWLDNLGLEMPTTTDEFREVLRAFKNDDPNGNGKSDEIPLSGSAENSLIPFLMNAFAYYPAPLTTIDVNPTLFMNDGQADIQANKEGWREGLRYIQSLYDEGLIDSSAFTQNGDAYIQQGDHANDVILGAAAAMHPGLFVTTGQENGRDFDYAAMEPLSGPDGTSYATYQPSSFAGATFVLTTQATQTEQIQAIKMLDYLFTDEGRANGHFGLKGTGWEEPEEGEIALDETMEPALRAIPEQNTGAWSAMSQYYHTEEFRNSQVTAADPMTPEGYERRLFEATQLYEPHADQDLVFPIAETWIDNTVASELATLQTNLGTYIQQSAVQFITGQKSLDSDWDSYLGELDGLGLDRFLEIYQQSYDASH
ncbi:ABC transporter substrate-binding protein [Streptomyces sp. 6N223]|uniref:ABC transporter substrate-binding protein n=1 Tax=Streptomyces sp. 6N223 TaxID=3457412 RepID=UPI003FD1C3CD